LRHEELGRVYGVGRETDWALFKYETDQAKKNRAIESSPVTTASSGKRGKKSLTKEERLDQQPRLRLGVGLGLRFGLGLDLIRLPTSTTKTYYIKI
jgi:hypothetical protein